MTYLVTIDYRRGASFGPLAVTAPNANVARKLAKREAKAYGFDQAVKKAVAVAA